MSSDKLRHLVLFALKPEVTLERGEALVARFRALESLVPGVEAFECGRDVSPEGLAQGFTHCFLLTFASAEARDAYLPHPDHQAFVVWAGPLIEKALVVDYWAR